ncbi:MAG TPA: hypothetical protein VJJ20_00060 [Candidatus Paceibacterota bacterium]
MNLRNFSLTLPVIITKQGKRFVAYTPVLDLSTVGKSEKDVQKKFAEAARLFIEELVEAGTVDEVLSELGWHQVQKQWNPPQVVSAESIGIRIPAFA